MKQHVKRKSFRALQAIALAIALLMLLQMNVFAAANSANVFYRSKKVTKKIALTFDDGPHPRYTERIIKILEKYNVKATFFVIGVNIENYPGILRKISEAGHEIGNHSYSHHNVKNYDISKTETEIKKCEEIIISETGVSPKLFRPPQGARNQVTDETAKGLGYSVILWSIDTLDWKNNPPDCITNVICKNIRGGDIILMHDYTSGQNTTCVALEEFIPILLKKGYEFVTVSELIENT